MRAIDGDALRDRLQNLGYDDWNQGVTTTWAEAFSECADMVADAPTIEPEPHWIPCKKQLPVEEDAYFVTVDPRYVPPGYRSTDVITWHDGKWVMADYFVLDGEGRKEPDFKVIELSVPIIAWMPLPKEYQEATDGTGID